MNTYCLAHPLQHSLVLLHSDQRGPFGPLPSRGVAVRAPRWHSPTIPWCLACAPPRNAPPFPASPYPMPRVLQWGFLSPTSRLDAGGALGHGRCSAHDWSVTTAVTTMTDNDDD